ncbi:MAG: peptidylprolyl isomerase [Sandaracinaceae bacterium]|nr:peptidylprolyl isomerase [Sandaracinaceae bacterium]MDW8246536.1 peptidylprolyl isomerase [Sandaracinaceae bacterium]
MMKDRKCLLVLGVLFWGCTCEKSSETERALPLLESKEPPRASPSSSEPHLAFTASGEHIIFAGTSSAEDKPAYDPTKLVRKPVTPDPEEGDFTLDEAVQGLPTDGQLVAEIWTDFGTIFCDLYADRTPRTVANFIGLARGIRPWWDARAGQWVKRPYYNGLTFHRVIPGYIIQGGDYLGDGTGDVGYTIPYEPHDTLRHDRAGMLALATVNGPDTGGPQFYITDGPAPQLDGTATIFGRCIPEHLIAQIARLPQTGSPDNRPLTPFRMHRVLIRRVQGGAAAARQTPPKTPPGEPEKPRGASKDPSELRSWIRELPFGTPSPSPQSPSQPSR